MKTGWVIAGLDFSTTRSLLPRELKDEYHGKDRRFENPELMGAK